MKFDILLISGTPASGKDTLSDELFSTKSNYVSLTKHKGTDDITRKGNYHYLTVEEFREEVSQGNFIQYHMRYGNYYGIHKNEISNLMAAGKIPIIHVGKYENLCELMNDSRIPNPLSILFYVPIEETIKRLNKRHPGNEAEIDQRVVAYKEEISQLRSAFKEEGSLLFHNVFKNEYASIDQALTALNKCINESKNELIDNATIMEIVGRE